MYNFTFDLHAPIQSWTRAANREYQPSDYVPNYAGLFGMICSACGIKRQDDPEKLRELKFDIRCDNPGQEFYDYHTASIRNYRPAWTRLPKKEGEYTLWADSAGKIMKQGYRSGSRYTISISHEDPVFLRKISYALAHPKWALYAGKRACPVSIFPTEIKDGDGYLRLLNDADNPEFEMLSYQPVPDADYREPIYDLPVATGPVGRKRLRQNRYHKHYKKNKKKNNTKTTTCTADPFWYLKGGN